MDVSLNLDVPPRTLATPPRLPARSLRRSLERKFAVMARQRPGPRAPDSGIDVARAVSVPLFAREDAGQEFGHQRAEEGQAGTYDADVCFDRGPCCCGGVVVRWVGAVGYGD